MKVNILILSFFILRCNIFSQELDTSFISEGITFIKIDNGERFSNPMIRYFKRSNNIIDQNKPIIDTIFIGVSSGINNWNVYDGPVRIFLHDKSNLWIGKYNKTGSRNDSVYMRIEGYYCYLFKDIFDLEIEISYNRDTNITFFSCSKYDTIKQAYTYTHLYYLNRFQGNGTKFSKGEGNHIYQCGNYGTLELNFSEKNLLESIRFFSNSDSIITEYTFYDNFFCKSYGHFNNKLKPIGDWYEYYDNGNLKSIGSKMLDKNMNGVEISIKNGKWYYFDISGNLIRNEHWIEGKLRK